MEKGLEEITLKSIINSQGPFDLSLLARLADYSNNLSKLKISYMSGLTPNDR